MHEPRPPTIQCAARAVAAWCDGADAMAPLLQLPAPEREIARAIARTQCQLIRFYVDKVRAGALLESVPEGRRELVWRYVQAHRKTEP